MRLRRRLVEVERRVAVVANALRFLDVVVRVQRVVVVDETGWEDTGGVTAW